MSPNLGLLFLFLNEEKYMQEITGSIKLLLKGLPITNDIVNSMVGKPINDYNGNKIGVIDYVDIENDIFHGTLSEELK